MLVNDRRHDLTCSQIEYNDKKPSKVYFIVPPPFALISDAQVVIEFYGIFIILVFLLNQFDNLLSAGKLQPFKKDTYSLDKCISSKLVSHSLILALPCPSSPPANPNNGFALVSHSESEHHFDYEFSVSKIIQRFKLKQ